MTPINLLLLLAERITEITKNYAMQESDGDHAMRAPRVWTQHLPEKLYADDVDTADFPFVLVATGGGTVDEELDGECSVAVLVAGYDDGILIDGKVRDRQGWLLPADMMWRIITDFTQDPIVGNVFKLQLPITWELPSQEKPSPHWFGVINMTWSVPIPERNINLENMEFRRWPTDAMEEEIIT